MIKIFLFELVLLELLLVFLFAYKYAQRTRGSLGALIKDLLNFSDKNDSIKPPRYHDFLTRELESANKKLSDAIRNHQYHNLDEVRQRIHFLEAEINAINNAKNNREVFWEKIIEAYSSLKPKIEKDDPELEKSRQEFEEKIEKLQKQISLLSAKNTNLEKFRSLFYEIQDNLEETQNINQQLNQELKKVSPDNEKIQELEELLTATEKHRKKLEKQNTLLELELSALTNRLEEGDNPDKEIIKPAIVFEQEAQSERKSDHTLAFQKLEIKELTDIIHELELEVKERDEIIKKMRSIENRANEIESVVSILEDENEFLRKQVEALVQISREEERERREIKDLKLELDSKNKEYSKLEDKFLQLETRFLKSMNK